MCWISIPTAGISCDESGLTVTNRPQLLLKENGLVCFAVDCQSQRVAIDVHN